MITIKDTHREKALSNKTPAPRRSTNMGVWAVGTLNQLFERGSLTETKLSKKSKAVTGKNQFSMIGPFCSYHSICLNIGFCHGSFVRK